MSAATRRPYLGETVHVTQEDGEGGVECLAAFVARLGNDDAVNLWILKARPGYTWMKYDGERRNGTYHWQH
jgi:hypothetical protein